MQKSNWKVIASLIRYLIKLFRAPSQVIPKNVEKMKNTEFYRSLDNYLYIMLSTWIDIKYKILVFLVVWALYQIL